MPNSTNLSEMSSVYPNAKTLASMEEVEAMISGEIPKRPQSVSEFAKEMGE